MKILHISWSDYYGGASKAAYNVHSSLLREGVDSHMLVQKRYHKQPSVHTYDNRIVRFLSRLNPYVDHLNLINYTLASDNFFTNARYSFFSLKKKALKLKPDVIHIHWIGKGCLSLNDMAEFNIPIFVTLHDSWFFTGGCHIIGTCTFFQGKCGSCPAINSSYINDASTFNFLLKGRIYSKINSLFIIGVSSWISQQARSSMLLRDKLIVTLPNPVDIQLFSPCPNKDDISRLAIATDCINILVGGFDLTTDKNKGFHILSESLVELSREINIHLYIFGDCADPCHLNLPCKVSSFGIVEDRQFLASLYASVDITVVPSLQESFCQVAAESIACGTPVVSFATSGIVDIVKHKYNGYLADPFSSASLATGIRWILSLNDRELIRQNARTTAELSFSFDIVAKRLVAMYSRALSSQFNS